MLLKLIRVAVSVLLSFALPTLKAAGQDTQIPQLRDDIPVVGDLDGGQHFLAVELKQGQTLQLDLREQRVNVTLALIKLAGEQIVGLSNFGSGNDRETLTYVAEQAGTYIIIVGTRTPPSKGRYMLEPHFRETTAAVRERVRAEQLLDEGVGKGKGDPSGLPEAIAKLGDALRSWQKVGEPYWEGYTLYSLGRVYDRLKDRAKALDYYNRALPRIRQAQDMHGESVTLNAIGLIYSDLGDKAKALEYYIQGVTLIKKVGSPGEEATSLHNLAAVYSDLRESTKALDYYNQALTSFRQLGDRHGEAHSLLGLGEVHDELGAKTKAIDYYGQAAKIYKEVGDGRGEGTALYDIAAAYHDLNDGSKSLDYYNRALEVFAPLGNKRDIADTLKAMGLLYSALGEEAAALNHFNRALSLFREVGDLRVEGSMLESIGVFYLKLGEKAVALDYLKEALPRFRQIKEQRREAETLLAISIIYSGLRKHEEALDYAMQSLALFRTIKDRGKEGSLLHMIGGKYWALGDKAKYISYARQALPILEETVDEGNRAVDLSNLALIYDEIGEKQKALDYLHQSLAYARYGSMLSAEPLNLQTLSQWWDERGNRRLAIFYAKLSVNKHQRRRDNLLGVDSDFQKSFLRDRQGGYEFLAELLIEEGQPEQAVQVLNLYQDQKFLDFDRDADSPAPQVGLTPREQAFAARYDSAAAAVGRIGAKIEELKQKTFNRQPNAQEAAQLQTLDAELKGAAGAYMDIIRSAETEFAKPSGTDEQITSVRDVVELQSALRELSTATKQKTAALYTLIGRDKFYVILVAPDARLKSFASAIKKKDFNDRVVEFYALLQSPVHDPRPLGQDLYNIIFKPVEAALKESGAQTLMWQLDGSLRYVPVAALFDGEKYLVERFQNVAFTRIDPGRTVQTVKPVWTGTGFGSSREYAVDLLGDGNKIPFPALPGVIQELQSIFRTDAKDSGILDGAIFTDQRFTKTAFYGAMKQRRPLVHISSHFFFKPGDDARSFLLLGDGTALTLSEMKRQGKLFDGIELLTLSACNTAATQSDANGKEIDGFAELAQRLGAQAVMATLWQVSDSSTPWLMRSFYAERQNQAGLTKATALRNAQLALLNGATETKSLSSAVKSGTPPKFKLEIIPDGSRLARANAPADIVYVEARNAPPFKPDERKPFAHPYYWSPFVLYGNAR